MSFLFPNSLSSVHSVKGAKTVSSEGEATHVMLIEFTKLPQNLHRLGAAFDLDGAEGAEGRGPYFARWSRATKGRRRTAIDRTDWIDFVCDFRARRLL